MPINVMNLSSTIVCLASFLALAGPAWADCKADISRFQKLLDSDVKVGHVGRSVYDKASAELAAAGKLCGSGQESAASAAVHASRSRHGYPPN